MDLSLTIKSFSFKLQNSLKTSQGAIKKKEGWLIKLETKAGKVGWGEISPINYEELKKCESILKALGKTFARETLEKNLPLFPGSLGFGLGAALAEIDSLIDFKDNKSEFADEETAFLLPTDGSIISELESKLHCFSNSSKEITIKWKVSILPNKTEKELLNQILYLLPINGHLRIDANAGWSRNQANDWVNYLKGEKRLEWIEQPLASNDIAGLTELATKVPIALDESLIDYPELRKTWKSWQIRKPSLEGDPRILLNELKNKVGFRTISTAFETGIGKRWIEYLATLQRQGPTPKAPGLGRGWCPNCELFSSNPELVWRSA